jgi:sulfur-oxidizing protein SoxZ
MSLRGLVSAPARVKRGEVFEVKTLVAHPMETGFRAGFDGRLIPRDIVTRMAVGLDGAELFAMEMSPAIAANPYVAFPLALDKGGVLTVEWHGDNGFLAQARIAIAVA